LIFERDKMLDEYYEAKGWDVETGCPTREAFVEVGLAEVAHELERLGRLPRSSKKG